MFECSFLLQLDCWLLWERMKESLDASHSPHVFLPPPVSHCPLLALVESSLIPWLCHFPGKSTVRWDPQLFWAVAVLGQPCWPVLSLVGPTCLSQASAVLSGPPAQPLTNVFPQCTVQQ